MASMTTITRPMAGEVAHDRTMSEGLTLAAYAGDGAVLLAFDADDLLGKKLAGFAVEYVSPDGATHPVRNRLSFDQPITSATTPEERTFPPTTEAPLQKFHWVHFPPDVQPGNYTYRATAMLFAPRREDKVIRGPSTEVSVEVYHPGEKFALGFTRGYISSQAYAEHFHNAPITPDPATIDFDTAPYERQYRWLGFHARRMIFDFIAGAVEDPDLSLDMFGYDLDAPDVIGELKKLGPRLRLYLDDSADHVKTGAHELAAHAALARTAGNENIRTGHFDRFAHNKVMILKRSGVPVKVLSGSANFSIRGLYVQSNNVFVIDDPAAAALYEQAFEQAWTDAAGFATSPIAAQWFELGGNGVPKYAVSFSPHDDPDVSLSRVTKAITQAQSSVLFAIMEIGSGTGSVLEAIRDLPNRKGIYAFGTTQRLTGALRVQAHGDPGTFIPFSYLSEKVPAPFQREWNGGAGQVIHHKFVVVDFNGDNPMAFAGSSNLAAGGEHANGDNLVAIADPGLVAEYAVEAIQLIDHYRFRAAMRKATDREPLRLKRRSENWAADYYKAGAPKYIERTVFAS